MSSNKYTLDRFEEDYAVFLQRPDEVEELLIHRLDIEVEVKAGDVVEITETFEGYQFNVLPQETDSAAERIKALRAKLNRQSL